MRWTSARILVFLSSSTLDRSHSWRHAAFANERQLSGICCVPDCSERRGHEYATDNADDEAAPAAPAATGCCRNGRHLRGGLEDPIDVGGHARVDSRPLQRSGSDRVLVREYKKSNEPWSIIASPASSKGSSPCADTLGEGAAVAVGHYSYERHLQGSQEKQNTE